MFVRGMGRVGDYVNRSWYDENWLSINAAPASIIPGVSNKTAAIAGGGIAALAAAALAAWALFKK